MNTKNTTDEDVVKSQSLGQGCYALTINNAVNTGVVIGEKSVLVVDPQPTPAASKHVLEWIGKRTDKPVRFVVLTHFHALHTHGAAAFEDAEILTSDLTRRLLEERSLDNWQLAKAREFQTLEAPGGAKVPNPTITFASSLTLNLGKREVRVMHLGRGHTLGDLVVWVPESGVLFSGGLVSTTQSLYAGDAHVADWPRALSRMGKFHPEALMPSAGKPLTGQGTVATALKDSEDYLRILGELVEQGVENGKGLAQTYAAARAALDSRFGNRSFHDEYLPFNVARAFDEAQGLEAPSVWTAARDRDLKSFLAKEMPAEEPAEAAAEDGDAPDNEREPETVSE